MGLAGKASGSSPIVRPDAGLSNDFSGVPSLLFRKPYTALGPPLSWPLGDFKALNQVPSPSKEFWLQKYQTHLGEACA